MNEEVGEVSVVEGGDAAISRYPFCGIVAWLGRIYHGHVKVDHEHVDRNHVQRAALLEEKCLNDVENAASLEEKISNGKKRTHSGDPFGGIMAVLVT